MHIVLDHCRDLIADSIETVMSAQWYDANVSLPGCDKNMPGSIIAMARLNRPSIMVYGGTIKPGYSQLDGSVLDIVSAFQSFGKWTVTWCESSIGFMLSAAAASLTAARLAASQRLRASYMQQLTVVQCA
jgi:dihydroxyacid dehydratase/phosphogluconate dehydratase